MIKKKFSAWIQVHLLEFLQDWLPAYGGKSHGGLGLPPRLSRRPRLERRIIAPPPAHTHTHTHKHTHTTQKGKSVPNLLKTFRQFHCDTQVERNCKNTKSKTAI